MEVLLLTADPGPGSVLPALTLVPHGVRTAAREVAALLDAGPHDAVLVDARTDLVAAPQPVPPLDALADTIQPFPTFAKVYLAAVKALRGKVTAARVPAPVG